MSKELVMRRVIDRTLAIGVMCLAIAACGRGPTGRQVEAVVGEGVEAPAPRCGISTG